MKRRSFIQAALLAVPGVSAVASERLHGVPGSIVQNELTGLRFTLPLSRSGVPLQFWRQLDALGTSIHDAMTSPEQGYALASDPAHYLQSRGLDASDRTLMDESVRLAVALAEPGVQQAIASGDYAGLLGRLEVAGLLKRVSPSTLQKNLEAILVAQAVELRRLLRDRTMESTNADADLLAMLDDGSHAVTVDDLAAVRDLLVRGTEAPTLMAAVVSIIAVVVTVVVAVMVAVVVAIPVVAYSATRSAGGVARLDSALIENYHLLSRVGTISGNARVSEHALTDLVRAEAVALVDAMEAVGIVRIPADRRDATIGALVAYSMRVASP